VQGKGIAVEEGCHEPPVIEYQGQKKYRQTEPPGGRAQRSEQMWDELIGIAVFIVLFVGGLIIFHLVEQWREQKRSK
jgi:hypothetical protein